MPRTSTLALPAALVAVGLLGLSGCATAGAARELPQWPLPPEKPRVKFVRAFRSEPDIRKGFLRGLARVFVPSPPDASISQPTGLALSPDEKHLYVACPSAARLLRVDLATGVFDLFASGDKAPSAPYSVATDGAGNVFVSDSIQQEILAYGPGGKFLRRFGRDKLDRPRAIALDRRRQLLYVVAGIGSKSSEHRVEVFSLAGAHLRTIGTRGAGPGEFNFPTGVTVAPDGTLYVVDMLNFRVQAFDPEGRLVGMFGAIGGGQPGTFDKAKSIALDAFGNLYVVDSQQAHVQMFNPRFQVLMAFGGRLQVPGYFMTPTAIAISSRNTIWVADLFTSVVNEYQLVNTTAEDGRGEPRAAPAASPPPGGQKPQGG